MSANPVARPASRRSFLTAAAAGITAGAVTLGAHAGLAEPDPVFALIAKERAAWDTFDRVIRKTDDVVLGRDNTPDEEAALKAADGAQMAALRAVMQARPTTAAGLIAAIDLFAERELQNVSSPVDDLLAGLLDGIRSFVRRTA